MTKLEAENKYNDYLDGHTGNVAEALELLSILDIPFVSENYDALKEICSVHDKSKYEEPEYTPYRKHYFPISDAEKLETEAYDNANLHHIKNNKHHWNYWLNDETGELEIPDENEYKLYCVERCCDWLAMAGQRNQVLNEWYNANKDFIQMPDYGWELCDEIMSKVPEKYSFSFRGTRGKLDESILNEEDIYDLRNRIIELKGKKYLDGIDKQSNGHAGYWALKKIVNSLEDKQGENVVKTGDKGMSSDEYNKIMQDVDREKKHPKYYTRQDGTKMIRNDAGGYEELDESFKVERGGKGYLLEASMQQLKRKTISEDPTRAKKSKHVQSKYIGISKYGVLNFETTSETHSGVKWYQEVHFPSFTGFMNIVENGDVIDTEDLKKAMSSDNIKISCDDPSFLYWAWKYMAYRNDYGLEKETRAPKRNNTRLQGALCKHLYSVIELINDKRILDIIAKDLNEFCRMKLGMSNDGYQDAEGMMNKDFKANQYDYNIEDVMKTLLSTENYNKYMDGTPLEDLGLSDKEMKDIEDAIKGMRDRSQFALRSELEKQFEPAKRGRRIKRDDIKLSVGNNEEEVDV